MQDITHVIIKISTESVERGYWGIFEIKQYCLKYESTEFFNTVPETQVFVIGIESNYGFPCWIEQILVVAKVLGAFLIISHTTNEGYV